MSRAPIIPKSSNQSRTGILAIAGTGRCRCRPPA
jgi:hypothetical protein